MAGHVAVDIDMYYVYILQSLKTGKYYIGSTENIEKRLNQHNNGASKWTSYHKPFKLVYSEKFKTRIESLRREKQIKSYKNGNAFRKLLD